MKLISLVLSAFLLSAVSVAPAYAGSTVSLQGCIQVDKPNTYTRGRFIWKPSGAHFATNAVVVSPRYYYPIPPLVVLMTMDNQLIEIAKLKTSGVCPGSPECLFQATYLTYQNGSGYSRKYGSIKVRISARNSGSTKACTYYVVNNPSRRAEYYGRLNR